MEYKIINKLNYAGKLKNIQLGTEISFYTKKQMKVIYPNKNYRVEGEIGNKTGIQCGVAESLNGQPLPVYKEKTFNKFKEKVVGFIAIDEHSYLAVVKNILIKRVIILSLLIATLSGGTTIAINYHSWFDNSNVAQSNSKKADIDENAQDWKGVLPNDKKSGTSTGIAIPGYKSIDLKANQKDQSISLVNPKQNSCYFVISLLLPDGTEIFKSKMIPPSKGLYKISLNKELKAGTYEKAILKYSCFKMDDNLTPLNGANVEVILKVE